jgi:polysaccharide biosynthesis/export protein
MTMKTVLLSTLVFLLATSPAARAQETGPATDRVSQAASASTGSAGMADYRLVVGDKLRIEVYRDPQLSQSLEIRPDGKITLPLIGDVPAAGATPQELATALTDRLREYITTPVVTVIVAEATPPMVYVMGEVNTPGAQPVRGPVTVLQALAVAGGFREFANTRRIRILRKGPDGTIQTIPFNYRDAVDRAERPVMLQPGDTVVVP